jgi:hypothetical protein
MMVLWDREVVHQERKGPAVRAFFATVALLVVGVLSLPASADLYPPGGVHVVPGQVSHQVIASGGFVTFSGGGFAPTSTLRLSVNGAPAGMTVSSTSGDFRVRLQLRGTGDQSLAASGLEPGGRLRVVSATVKVTGGGFTVAGLPTTGSDVYSALVVGLGSVAVGIALLFAASTVRRRSLVSRFLLPHPLVTR